MMIRLYKLARRSTVLLGAGMLFQTSGCALDTQAIFTGLATSIVNNLISSIVFGAFNVVGP